MIFNSAILKPSNKLNKTSWDEDVERIKITLFIHAFRECTDVVYMNIRHHILRITNNVCILITYKI